MGEQKAKHERNDGNFILIKTQILPKQMSCGDGDEEELENPKNNEHMLLSKLSNICSEHQVEVDP